MSTDAAVLTVDLDALARNFHVLRTIAGRADVVPVVKADGYGLGAGPVARRLWAEGARSFFVGRLAEGEDLRHALGDREAEILVLDGATRDGIERLKAAGLVPVLNTIEQARSWAGEPAAVQIGTGMNRMGLDLAEALAIRDMLSPIRVISHLACASQPHHPMNGEQLAAFQEAIAHFPGVPASLANSAGTFLGPDYGFDFVRPGIALYGGGPFDASDARLSPVASLHAPILQVRDIGRGARVGYGATFVAPGPMRIATVAAGYSDGLLRAAGGKAWAAVDGHHAAYVGRVSMDLIALDVTEIPAAVEGASAELLGPNVLVDDLAQAAGTIAYEVLVRLSGRAERRYIGEA